MTEQMIIMRADALEHAIQTLIHDLRVPKKLRTALAVYQNQRAGLVNRGLSLLPARSSGQPEGSGGIADVCQRDNSRSPSDENRTILSQVRTTIGQGVEIQMWLNDESLDWSVEINGQRHENVTSEVMEALVECAVIVAETSVMKVLVTRPQ
jgi:hypothetical protein